MSWRFGGDVKGREDSRDINIKVVGWVFLEEMISEEFLEVEMIEEGLLRISMCNI